MYSWKSPITGGFFIRTRSINDFPASHVWLLEGMLTKHDSLGMFGASAYPLESSKRDKVLVRNDLGQLAPGGTFAHGERYGRSDWSDERKGRLLGGELPTNRKWVSSPQWFQWINPLQKSHVNHWGELTHKNDSWVVRLGPGRPGPGYFCWDLGRPVTLKVGTLYNQLGELIRVCEINNGKCHHGNM